LKNQECFGEIFGEICLEKYKNGLIVSKLMEEKKEEEDLSECKEHLH